LHCVGQFYTGNEAIVNLVTLKPDVILMDIKLPDMSGIEVMSKIKPLMEEYSFYDVYKF
jgi:CheY-like chemotaxis protein